MIRINLVEDYLARMLIVPAYIMNKLINNLLNKNTEHSVGRIEL